MFDVEFGFIDKNGKELEMMKTETSSETAKKLTVDSSIVRFLPPRPLRALPLPATALTGLLLTCRRGQAKPITC